MSDRFNMFSKKSFFHHFLAPDLISGYPEIKQKSIKFVWLELHKVENFALKIFYIKFKKCYIIHTFVIAVYGIQQSCSIKCYFTFNISEERSETIIIFSEVYQCLLKFRGLPDNPESVINQECVKDIIYSQNCIKGKWKPKCNFNN